MSGTVKKYPPNKTLIETKTMSRARAASIKRKHDSTNRKFVAKTKNDVNKLMHQTTLHIVHEMMNDSNKRRRMQTEDDAQYSRLHLHAGSSYYDREG